MFRLLSLELEMIETSFKNWHIQLDVSYLPILDTGMVVDTLCELSILKSTM
jgi:hypothetical protein